VWYWPRCERRRARAQAFLLRICYVGFGATM
jgi:hypothetical protein